MRVAMQRVVVTGAVGEVADVVDGRGLIVVAQRLCLVEAEELALAFDILVRDRIVGRLLPLDRKSVV